MIRRRHWVYALLLAVALHLTGFVAVLAQNHDEGALAAGELGMEIDLGMLGDLGEATETLPETVAEATPEPLPEPEPVKPVAPEPPPPAKVEPPTPPKQKAELKVKAKPEPVKKPPVEKPTPEPAPVTPPARAETSSTKQATETQQTAQRKMTTGRADSLATGGNPAAQRSYFSLLASRLAKHKRYPVASRRRGEEGVVRLAFELDRSGKVLNFSIAESSGSKRLDNAVLDMLKKAQPLPPFPDDMTQDRLTIKIPIEFSLHDK